MLNPCHAEPGYALLLQTVLIQISWLLKKPTDLDLHCLVDPDPLASKEAN